MSTNNVLDNDPMGAQIPYYAHEGEMARMERINKRWFIAFVLVLAALILTNAAWIIYEHQFETYQVEQDVDTGDGSAYVAGIGDVIYGESDAADKGAGAEDQQQKSNENLP